MCGVNEPSSLAASAGLGLGSTGLAWAFPQRRFPKGRGPDVHRHRHAEPAKDHVRIRLSFCEVA